MSLRRLLLAAAVSAALSASYLPRIVLAEDATDSQDVETAKHNFIGVINSPNVVVRSAPREDAYPTLRLDKGDKITVVGIKYKFLKILPPPGSFAYVPKAYVNQRGDGKLGRASREIIAKVGSSLNQLKTAHMGKIDDGQDVEIIGDQDEYWKITPPAGSYVYINEAYVDPLKALPTVAEEKAKTAEARSDKPHTSKPATPAAPNEGTPVTSQTPDALATATPEATPAAAPVAPVQPNVEVQAAFEKLEADFKAGNERPITEQPIDTLLTGYTDLLKQDSLTPTMRKISEVRVSTLKLRVEAKTEFLASREAQQQAIERQKALAAERDEIKERIKEKAVTMYTAVGTLRASSLQRSGGTLYRLTDPATGRTVAYIRAADTRFAALLGQFVGIKGRVSVDPALNMKLIDPSSDAEAVDPSKVNTSVAAQIIPPSLMPMHASNTPTD